MIGVLDTGPRRPTSTASGLAPDPVVPARDALLDADALGERLSRLAGLPVEVTERVRVKYRIGESLRVLARVDVAGSEELVALRTFPPGRLAHEATRAARRAVRSAILPPVLVDDDASALFWTLPNDRRIDGLEDVLARPGLVAPALRGRWAASEVVSWSPERCVTVRALDANGRTLGYAKCFPTPAEALAVAARYAAIARAVGARRSPLRVPAVLATAFDPAVVVLAPAAGAPATGSAGSEALGAALAQVHELPPPPFAPFARLRSERIARTADLIALARPDSADAARALAEALRRTQRPHEAPVLLHGDVHSANVLVSKGRATLIDFDQCGVGPAATDLGSALARHLRDRVAGRADDTRERARGLLDGYSSVRALPCAEALAWHTSAAVLAECGMRAVNRLHEDVLPHLTEVLDAGRRLLEDGDA